MANTAIYNVSTGEMIVANWTQDEIDVYFQRQLPERWKLIREKRNELLTESDYIFLQDKWNSLSEIKKQEWTEYRQALRDVPENQMDPFKIIWPTKPE